MNEVNILLKKLFKKWWLFFIVALISGILGVWYASNQKPVYESRLTFALDGGNDASGSSGAASLAAQFGLNLGGGAKDVFSGDNILEIMRSRRMIEQVFLSSDTFNNQTSTLIDYFLKIEPAIHSENVHFSKGQPKTSFSYKQDSMLFACYLNFSEYHLAVQKPDKKLNVYEVKVISTDEKFSKIFTDRLVAATNDFFTEICTKKSKETLEILEKRVEGMKENISSSLSSRAEIQDINVNPAFSAAQVPLLRQQTNIQVYNAAYAEMFKNLEIARYQYLKGIPLMQIIDAADYPMKKIKKSRLEMAILFALLSGVILLCILLSIYLFFDKKSA